MRGLAVLRQSGREQGAVIECNHLLKLCKIVSYVVAAQDRALDPLVVFRIVCSHPAEQRCLMAGGAVATKDLDQAVAYSVNARDGGGVAGVDRLLERPVSVQPMPAVDDRRMQQHVG
jgi:hypothetical protein